MAERRGARTRVFELVLEATLVVFAVLVALALEEWSQKRGLMELASRAEAAVLAEMEANLAELRSTEEQLGRMQVLLAEVIEAEDISALNDELELTLPDLSRAAWEVAQGSDAAPYFEYEWVIEVARAYEVLEIYAEASGNLIAAMSAIIGRDPTVDRVSDIYGWLAIINEIHAQAATRLEETLSSSRD
jgi:hypothetical protein